MPLGITSFSYLEESRFPPLQLLDSQLSPTLFFKFFLRLGFSCESKRQQYFLQCRFTWIICQEECQKQRNLISSKWRWLLITDLNNHQLWKKKIFMLSFPFRCLYEILFYEVQKKSLNNDWNKCTESKIVEYLLRDHNVSKIKLNCLLFLNCTIKSLSSAETVNGDQAFSFGSQTFKHIAFKD